MRAFRAGRGGHEGLERRPPPRRPEANAAHLGLSDGGSEGEQKKKFHRAEPTQNQSSSGQQVAQEVSIWMEGSYETKQEADPDAYTVNPALGLAGASRPPTTGGTCNLRLLLLA